jgi:CHAT domain-containing protein
MTPSRPIAVRRAYRLGALLWVVITVDGASLGRAQDVACEARAEARVLREEKQAEPALALLDALPPLGTGNVALGVTLGLDRAELLLDLWRVDEAAATTTGAETLLGASGGLPGSCGEPDEESSTRALEIRARTLRVKGDYGAASSPWRAALAARRGQSPPNPAGLAQMLVLGAELAWLAGDADEAERMFAEIAALAAESPQLDLLVSRALSGLGLVAETRGELPRAEDFYRRALDAVRFTRGDAHPAAAGRWISIGNLAVLREDLLTADAAYEQAAAILEPLTDRSLASDKATLALNRGSLDARLGRVDSAREQLQRARELWTETRGPDHPHLAWVSESLADLLADAGRLEEAGTALADAQARRQRGMPGSPITVLTTARLAALRAREGKYAEARALLRRVDTDALRMAPAGRFFQANLAGRRAEVFETLGDLETAARLRAEVEVLLERQLPAGHPGVADALGQRARLAWRMGRRRLALRWAMSAWQAQRRVVAQTIHALPESDALRYVERTRELRDLVLCAAAGSATGALSRAATDEIMRTLAASRGLSSGGLQARGRSTSAAGDEEVRTAQRRYAALLWQQVGSATDDYAAELRRARGALETVERREIRGAAPAERGAQASDAWAALAPGEALVSFGRYRCPATGAASTDTGDGYLAFVRTRVGAARTVRFPDAPALDRAVDDWYASITAAIHAPPTEAQDEEVDARGRALTKALWAPLAAAIGTAERVFIVPDGKLHSVSWYALPTMPGSYLVDAPRQVHVLTAESDLLLPTVHDAPSRESSVVVMADPQLQDAEKRADASALRSACQFVDPLRLPRLGEARAEARQVEELARATERPVLLATGLDASEGWLRAHASRASILHLAAHGGVLSPESCREPLGTAAEPAAARVRSLWAEAVRARPLLRSGLLLAGAAGYTPLDAPGSEDDGVLVAEEAARLDLHGADWVVLSACSTRRGPVVDAEGALGLHRAFHSAGARTVIASLWDVQDAPARRFMQALYTARLRDGKSTAHAMRDAQRAVLAELRANGRSTHPVQWAAFVASGDWR